MDLMQLYFQPKSIIKLFIQFPEFSVRYFKSKFEI